MKLSKAYDQYGAQMGRRDMLTEPQALGPFHVQRVRLNSGGYDSGGAYWGTGTPLWHARGWGADEVQELFYRAPDRDAMKRLVRAKFPNARFYK